ncbi:unnamed protein product [Camellia sinensis]
MPHLNRAIGVWHPPRSQVFSLISTSSGTSVIHRREFDELATMSSQSKRREMDLMKLMMSDYKVEMINDGMQEFCVDFHGPNAKKICERQSPQRTDGYFFPPTNHLDYQCEPKELRIRIAVLLTRFWLLIASCLFVL